ncbi:MAG TPA: hypothetical protein VIJ22_12055 [Polyangiaceae bacterium]
MGRARSTDKDKTVKRQIDVAEAFAAAERAPKPGASLDAVPVLVVPRADVPWSELGDLATKLLLRVDGATTTRDIATAAGSIAAPEECAREMAALAGRGLLELKSTRGAEDGEALDLELDIDLSML